MEVVTSQNNSTARDSTALERLFLSEGLFLHIHAIHIITKSWENNRCMQSLKIFVVKRYTEISLNEEMRQDVLYST